MPLLRYKDKMIAEQLISFEVPPLKLSDNGLRAMAWMEELRVHHLPIVNGRKYLGIVSEDDIFEMNKPELPFSEHKISLIAPQVRTFQHVFDVLKVMTELKLSVIPVINEKDEYYGAITRNALIDNIAQMSSVKEPGAVVMLSMKNYDYNLTQLAGIVESEGGKILNLYVNATDAENIDLILKINRTDLSSIKNALFRYKYHIKALYHESEFDEDLKRSYEMLINYMNM